MAAPSPNDIADPTLLYSITVDGTALPDEIAVTAINITHEVNRISYAEVSIIDGNDELSSFPVSDASGYVPGGVIEIKAGYEGVTQTTIFKGCIVKQAIQVNATESLTKLICKDSAVQMTFSKKEAEFDDKTDSSIISSIIGTYSDLTSSVTATSVQQESVFQKLATDWDFILSRAEFNGQIVTLEAGKVTVGPPATSGSAVLSITKGDSLITFNAELSAEKQPTAVNATAWDIKNQALLKVTAAEPSVNSQGNITAQTLSGKLSQSELTLNSCTPMLNDELKAWADGNLLKARLAAIKGSVSFIGSALVKPNTLITLAGVGDRFNGDAFVSAVNHVIEDGAWTTNVKFGLDSIPVAEKPGFSYPVAAGQLPAIHGLQVATVMKISEDPDNQYRVKVNLVSNADSQTGIWARMATFFASSGFGSGFVPDVGDEVVLGFLEANPRYPVILGSLYSSTKKPANPAADENNYLKGIITKTQMKLSFDDEKKITKIETPGGNSFMLNDDSKSIEVVDQNGNSVKMNSSGITMNSGKDINITATGNITLSATGKLNLTATQDAAVSGMNVTNTAQVGFTAKGNATAEVSASGQTTIKGGIVMIN